MAPVFDLDSEGLRDVLSTIPDFVLVVDREGFILYINRLEPGYEMDQVVGTHTDVVMEGESKDVHRDAVARTIETGESQGYEVSVRLPDGTRAWYRSRTFPLVRATEIVAISIVATNVTELKQTQAALEDLRRLLPLCAWCGRIRNSDGSWEDVTTYLKREAGTDVTHGLCPTCAAKEMQGLSEDDDLGGGAA